MIYFYGILAACYLAAIVAYHLIYRYVIAGLSATTEEERKEQKYCRPLLSKYLLSR